MALNNNLNKFSREDSNALNFFAMLPFSKYLFELLLCFMIKGIVIFET